MFLTILPQSPDRPTDRPMWAARRRFSSSLAAALKAAPGKEQLKRIEHVQTSITALPNGVRVASESTPGHFSAVGVYLDAGSADEVGSSLHGCTHFHDRLSFKSTGCTISWSFLSLFPFLCFLV
jgi:hypothetical protein